MKKKMYPWESSTLIRQYIDKDRLQTSIKARIQIRGTVTGSGNRARKSRQNKNFYYEDEDDNRDDDLHSYHSNWHSN